MATVRPFKALRPKPEYAAKVAALPYDVMSSAEAREMVKGNPYSFLHIDRAEIDLPVDTYIYDDKVYQTAAANLHKLISDGVLVREEKPCFYVYRQIMNGRAQTGIVGCAAIDDYFDNTIRKHELTRSDKEEDRVRHVDVCDANTGPIFLAYKARPKINQLVAQAMTSQPLYDFVSDGVQQTAWIIDDPAVMQEISAEFEHTKRLYIADGHHRNASAARVGKMRREQCPGWTGDEEFNYYLAVFFPDEQLYIMDYNRLVKDLNGLSEEQFFTAIRKDFTVEPYAGTGPCHPPQAHSFGMYISGKWYLLTAKPGSFNAADPVAQLDASILQDNLLTPILAIHNPRTDKRIDFIGGIRGLEELERRVDEGMAVAFAMYPTSIQELIDVAEANEIMPPKSTWFEPKLLSGLFIHEFNSKK